MGNKHDKPEMSEATKQAMQNPMGYIKGESAYLFKYINWCGWMLLLVCGMLIGVGFVYAGFPPNYAWRFVNDLDSVFAVSVTQSIFLFGSSQLVFVPVLSGDALSKMFKTIYFPVSFVLFVPMWAFLSSIDSLQFPVQVWTGSVKISYNAGAIAYIVIGSLVAFAMVVWHVRFAYRLQSQKKYDFHAYVFQRVFLVVFFVIVIGIPKTYDSSVHTIGDPVLLSFILSTFCIYLDEPVSLLSLSLCTSLMVQSLSYYPLQQNSSYQMTFISKQPFCFPVSSISPVSFQNQNVSWTSVNTTHANPYLRVYLMQSGFTTFYYKPPSNTWYGFLSGNMWYVNPW